MNLMGLVACGGQSSRMGKDKSLLEYHGKPQRYYLYDMLGRLCQRVFISCNGDQAKQMPVGYDLIVDAPAYTGIGPMASLLSAFEMNPHSDFLVVGCDYPFVTESHLRLLIEAQSETKDAVCFTHDNVLEPLMTIYRSTVYPRLLNNFKLQKLSLRHFLGEIKCTSIPLSASVLLSVDDEAGYQFAVNQIDKG